MVVNSVGHGRAESALKVCGVRKVLGTFCLPSYKRIIIEPLRDLPISFDQISINY